VGVTRAVGTLCIVLVLAPNASGCGNHAELVIEAPDDVAREAKSLRVPYPPPPAEVEVLPLRRRDECLWRDGYWRWDGASWAWESGAWIVPPEDCEYVRPATLWKKDNGNLRLVFHPPEWRPTEPGLKCAEPRACSSLLPESQVQ
jgi:hypothetical protein